jgi:Domain of unknown function (DUF4304)
MDARKQFLGHIKQVFTPVLKADGFAVNGRTYRRVRGEVIHVVALQGAITGGRCCVCLGIHLGFLPCVGSTGPTDASKIQEQDCEFRRRLAPPGESDSWWNYGMTEREAKESVESICQVYQEVGEPYFRQFSTFPEDFTRVTPATLATTVGDLPFPVGGTLGRRLLALSRIALRVGRTSDARSFAELGIANAGQATFLKNAFKQIIATV